MFNLPREFKDSDLGSTVAMSRVEHASAVAAARDAVAAERVVIIGPAGSGKTTLAAAIGRAAMSRRDVNGMFATSFALERARTESPLGHGDASTIVRAMQVPVLVLDELGAEQQTTRGVMETVHDRHAQWQQTIITFALPTSAMIERYSAGVVRRLFVGAYVIRCDQAMQPAQEQNVKRVPVRPPWNPPPPRSSGVAIDPTPEGLAAVIQGIGNGPKWKGPEPGRLSEADYATAEDDLAATGTE